MSDSGKPTIALERKEFEVLESIRRLAPRYNISTKQAEAYGVWTVCYRRYCKARDIPWLWMSSVSDFMDFLDTRDEVSKSERNRALDGIMYYLTDVRQAEDEEDAEKSERRRTPNSTRSLFGQLLLRCNIELTEAFKLRFEDVRLGESSVKIKDDDEDERVIEVPPSMRSGLKKHLQRLRERTDADNPLLFGHRGLEAGDEGEAAPDRTIGEDADPARTTKLATMVMQSFDDGPKERTKSESSSSHGEDGGTAG
jgi:hypothetical protein